MRNRPRWLVLFNLDIPHAVAISEAPLLLDRICSVAIIEFGCFFCFVFLQLSVNVHPINLDNMHLGDFQGTGVLKN